MMGALALVVGLGAIVGNGFLIVLPGIGMTTLVVMWLGVTTAEYRRHR
jgi:hypothetical protein